MDSQEEIKTEVPLATAQHRIAAVFVDIGLSIVTLGIGSFIWSMVVWNYGQTPGKTLLKIRVLDATTHKPVNWLRMLIRQVLIPFSLNIFWYLPALINRATGSYGFSTLGSVCLITCLLISLGFWITDFVWLLLKGHRRLVDYWANTIVVNEAAR